MPSSKGGPPFPSKHPAWNVLAVGQAEPCAGNPAPPSSEKYDAAGNLPHPSISNNSRLFFPGQSHASATAPVAAAAAAGVALGSDYWGSTTVGMATGYNGPRNVAFSAPQATFGPAVSAPSSLLDGPSTFAAVAPLQTSSLAPMQAVHVNGASFNERIASSSLTALAQQQIPASSATVTTTPLNARHLSSLDTAPAQLFQHGLQKTGSPAYSCVTSTPTASPQHQQQLHSLTTPVFDNKKSHRYAHSDLLHNPMDASSMTAKLSRGGGAQGGDTAVAAPAADISTSPLHPLQTAMFPGTTGRPTSSAISSASPPPTGVGAQPPPELSTSPISTPTASSPVSPSADIPPQVGAGIRPAKPGVSSGRVRKGGDSKNNKKERFKCDRCAKDFAQRGSRERHIRTVHLGERRFECKYCHFRFQQSFDLKSHITSVHLKERKFHCEFNPEKCTAKFSRKAKLQLHIKAVHQNIRNHVCPQCNQPFAERSNLMKHVRHVHENIRCFPCSRCGTRFKERGHLKKHLSSIHLSGKYSCMRSAMPEKESKDKESSM